AGQNGGERVERAFVCLLEIGGIIAPLLYRRQFFMLGLAAQIMRGVGHHADVNAVLVMSIEKVLEHHGAAALAPFRPALAVGGAAIVRCFLGRINVRMPIDDHAYTPMPATQWAQAAAVNRRGGEDETRALPREVGQVSGTKSYSPIPCRTRNTADVSPALVTRCGRFGGTEKVWPRDRRTSSFGCWRKTRIVPSRT